MANKTGIVVVNDFRTADVKAGGQGAPLVPIGEKFLFSEEFDAFINLGGFANISFKEKDRVLAFDICPCNLPMNRIVETLGLEYDKDGELSRQGTNQQTELQKLNALPYYSAEGPKSLGIEWMVKEYEPILSSIDNKNDRLATHTEHVSEQIAELLNKRQLKKVLLTGGGAKNGFLVEKIRAKSKAEIVVPEEELIDFKEALIFAFLGLRHLEGKTTTLSSVTGASKDLVTGQRHLPH